jgi:hypothetical protein
MMADMFFVAGSPGHFGNAIWHEKADLHHDGGIT